MAQEGGNVLDTGPVIPAQLGRNLGEAVSSIYCLRIDLFVDCEAGTLYMMSRAQSN